MNAVEEIASLSNYDFIDFGCSKGGSILFGMEFFGGTRGGLGIDIDAKKVDITRKAGFNAIQMDASQLDPLTMGKTRFAIMSHFLEHLPTIETARKCISAACRTTTDFVLVQQPYFEADGYLFDRGLKLYWSDWRGHILHMTSIQLHRIFTNLLAENELDRFLLLRRKPIKSSGATEIHPLVSPIDQHAWDAATHAPKPLFDFEFPVYRETCAIALHGTEIRDPKLQLYISRSDVYFDSLSSQDTT